MQLRRDRTPTGDRLRLALFLSMIVACALLGGSSRPDVVGLVLLRGAAVAYLAFCVWTVSRQEIAGIRTPLLLLVLLGGTIVVQLIPLPLGSPLPPDLAGGGDHAQGAAPWRPISLTPDRSWNSLVALIVPLAALLGFASFGGAARLAGPLVISLAVVSSLLGVAQIVGGERAPLFFYEHAHRSFPSGLLANRNHQAAFLAAAIPLLRVWAIEPQRRAAAGLSRAAIAFALGMFFAVLVVVTGSRSGLALLCVALLGTVAIRPRLFSPRLPQKIRWAIAAAAIVLVLGLIAAALYLGRAIAVDRLAETRALEDGLRIANVPAMLSLLRQTLPLGGGYGSFDQLFRGVEADSLLRWTYFNNAHNDLLELAITGGVPALLILTGFLGWLAVATFRAFRSTGSDPQTHAARAASIGVIVLLLGSLTDYPLRTPLLATVCAIFCAQLAQQRKLS